VYRDEGREDVICGIMIIVRTSVTIGLPLTRKKILANSALLPWIVTLCFIFGPVRWELAHTYGHLIEEPGDSLPLLTRALSLPVLGIAPSSLAAHATAVFFWGFIWLGLAGLLASIWRATTREDLLDRFVYGGSLYVGTVFLLLTLTIVGLALPFAFV
jgi:hypothetical protein